MIYFARAVGTNLVKIGHAVDPAERVRNLQTGCPHVIELLATRNGSRDQEAVLHERFAASRRAGEWFSMTPGLAEEIALSDADFARVAARQIMVRGLARLVGAAEPGPTFCANDFWFDRVHPALDNLVGWSVAATRPEVADSASYDAVYDTLCNLLPDCGRRCGCVSVVVRNGRLAVV